ncbi:MAG: alpha/beta fold hydrolase [Lautropia sp.]
MTHQFIQVGDINIHYELADYTEPWRSEEPETFLLHSGYCRNMEFWRTWVPLLGLKYRVLRVDPRGWGLTSKPKEGDPITLDMMAADMIGLMDALKIKKVHWVGDSTGGVVGLKAAHDYPDRLSSLSVFNSASSMATETRSIYALDMPDQAQAIMKYGVEDWSWRTIHYRCTPEHAPPGLHRWIAKEMGKTPDYIAAAGFRHFSTVDLIDLIPNIKTPTLLILGTKSMESRYRKMEHMRDTMPNAKLLKVDGWEQGLHMVEPEKMVGEIRKFLDERVYAKA